MSLTITDLPAELIAPIKALSDQTRRKLLLLLEKSPLSYSQIQSCLQIEKGTLNHHLRRLISAALIRNYGIDTPGTPYTSYYSTRRNLFLCLVF